MKKNKKTFILYQYNQFNNDYEYLKEYYSIKELVKDEKIKIKNYNSIYHYIFNKLDEINHLLNDKYIIISETIEEL